MYMNIDTILKVFVAPNIIEKIRYEINYNLFYHSAKISPESLHLYQMQNNDTMFIDNVFDYPLAYSFSIFKQAEDKIVEIWEHILLLQNFVASHWLHDECQDKDLATGEISSMAHPLSIVAKKLIQKKRAYAETIGIAYKVINIAIEKDNSCILKFLKKYIVQNDHSLVENTTSVSSSSQTTNLYKEYSEPNNISKSSPVKVTNSVKKN
ncbi:23090_t:CDS:2 [Dentiscutata erythropus]|uniref:23090_t:CDS:1 n=1 Tax=Dentiscutata erythropus TaxID=1348616 RepID=A0A9N9IC63_9GLOM|nr:23090_t:CDS:2 [Dentiscutata erythropus]